MVLKRNKAPAAAVKTAAPGRRPARGQKKKAAGGKQSPRDKRKAYSSMADRMSLWKPASKVLIEVEAVPTCFPWLDWASGVDGLPLRRFGIVHGPAGAGKTKYVLGLMLSFLQRGHFAGFMDAERTTPHGFAASLMREVSHHERFVAMKPDSYEQAVDGVDQFCTSIADARAHRQIPEETAGLVILDSLTKLIPMDLLKKIKEIAAEKEKGSIDGLDGAAGRYIAALNTQWLKRLTAVLDDTRCTLIAIVRERVNMQARTQYDRRWTLPGGKDVDFESSLSIRVRCEQIKQGTSEKAKVLGEIHHLRIYKTKVGESIEKEHNARFHTSKGVLTPAGFDRPRDLLTLAQHLGAIRPVKREKPAGLRYVDVDGVVLVEGDTEHEAVAALHADPLAVVSLAELCARNPKGVRP